MGIVNKRNAVVGYLVVKAGKRAVKKKAHETVPDKRTGGAVAGAVAAAGGAIFFWRRRRGAAGE
jgi:hypothetical protein